MGKQEYLTDPGTPSSERPTVFVADIPIELIAFDLNQPRKLIEGTNLHQLAEDIRQNGVRQRVLLARHKDVPWVRVRPEHKDRPYRCVAGERRTRASELCGLKTVPAEVRDYVNKMGDYRKDQCATNNNSQQLSCMEEAAHIDQLLNDDLSASEIAPLMGLSVSAVRKRQDLVALDPRIAEEYLDPHKPRRLRIGVGLAEELASLPLHNLTYIEQIATQIESVVQVPVRQPSAETGNSYWHQHLLQNVLFDVIIRDGMNDGAAIAFIKESLGVKRKLKKPKPPGPPRERSVGEVQNDPERELRRLVQLTRQVIDNDVLGMSPHDFQEVLCDLPEKKLSDFKTDLRMASEMLAALAGQMDQP